MIRKLMPMKGPKDNTTFLLRMPLTLKERANAYCARNDNAPLTSVIVHAIENFLDDRVQPELPAEFLQELNAFCRANLDSNPATVIAEAVRPFIDRKLKKDSELRDRYEQLIRGAHANRFVPKEPPK